jgi:hypothetical protein
MIEVQELEDEVLVDREDPVNGTATINATALVCGFLTVKQFVF